MNPSILTVVFATILLKETVTAFDYCQKTLNCPANAKHIGCGSTENFGKGCPAERALVPMTADLKAYFLKIHNQARSDIANGKISGYKSANRMVEMVRKLIEIHNHFPMTITTFIVFIVCTDMG